MKHLHLSKILGGKLTSHFKLRALQHLARAGGSLVTPFGGSLVHPHGLQHLRISDEGGHQKKRVSKPLKFRL